MALVGIFRDGDYKKILGGVLGTQQKNLAFDRQTKKIPKAKKKN